MSGLLDSFMNGANPATGGFTTDPLANIAMGLLANSGPSYHPVNPWAGAAQGLFRAEAAQKDWQQYQQEKQVRDAQLADIQSNQRFAAGVAASADAPFVAKNGPLPTTQSEWADRYIASGNPELVQKGIAMKLAKPAVTIYKPGEVGVDVNNNPVFSAPALPAKDPAAVATYKLTHPGDPMLSGFDAWNMTQRSAGTPSSTPIFDQSGAAWAFDHRTKQLTPLIGGDGKQITGAQFTPSLQGEVAGAKAEGKKEGEGSGDAANAYKAALSKLPTIEKTVKELSALGQTATYTKAGQLYDAGRRQLGLTPRQASVDREEYIAKVRTQIFPLLRDTFGAQFTRAEGDALVETLGAPDKAPAERDAILRSFINQKYNDLEAGQNRLRLDNPTAATPAGAPVTPHFGGGNEGWNPIGGGFKIRVKQ